MSRTLQDVIDAVHNGTEHSTTDRSFLKKEFRLQVLVLLNHTVANSVKIATTKSDFILNLIRTELENLEAEKAAASAAAIAATVVPITTTATTAAAVTGNGNPGLFAGIQQQQRKAHSFSSVVASTASTIASNRNLPSDQQDLNIVDLIMYTFKYMNIGNAVVLIHGQSYGIYSVENISRTEISLIVLPTVSCAGIDAIVTADPDAIGFALSQASINYFVKCQIGYDLSGVIPADLISAPSGSRKRPHENSTEESSQRYNGDMFERPESTEDSRKPRNTVFTHGTMTMTAAKVISIDAKKMGETGIFSVVPKLNSSIYCNFWSLQTTWVNQNQPIQVLNLARNMNVDIKRFALVNEKLSPRETQELRVKHYNVSLDLDKTLAFDEKIIGNDIHKLDRAMRAFCLTIDVLFMLKSGIRDELRAVVIRCIEFVTPQLVHGPNSELTGEQLTVVGAYFTYSVSQIFQDVVGDITRSEMGVITALEKIPDIERNSDFATDILRISLKVETPEIPPKKPKPKPIATEKPTPTITPPKPSPAAKALLICGFFNSTGGCKATQGACSRDHRKSKDPADDTQLDTFFKSRAGSNLVRKG